MITRSIFIVVFALVTLQLQAQRRLGTVTGADTTVKTEIVPVTEPNAARPRSVLSDSVRIAFKCSPVLLLTGELPAFVEYRVNRFYSVEAAIGVTYTDLFYETSVNNGYFLSNENAKFRSGWSFRGQGRIFPRHADVAIAGFYIGPEFTFRTYKMDWYEFTGLVYDVYPGLRKVSEIRLAGGWQNAENSNEPFVDFYIAAGIRQTWENRATEIPNQVSPAYHRVAPNFGIGLKFGWGM
ncbi:MAG: hypothetical protein FD123_2120 [Bacteroidetes bacterium]|nr:MAG: hypothetical protein FD123_2120 [Bacteroidota bacterium]